MNERFRHLAPLLRIGLLVAVVDWLTKAAAVRLVGHEPAHLSEWLHLAVVHNEGAVLGVSLGPYTWQLNLALTLGAMFLVVPVSRELAQVDRLAPRALGFILGGALGNFGSLVLQPRGVVDFIALRLGEDWLVLNVADVAAYVGLALMVRTGFIIVAELRRSVHERPARPAAALLRIAPLEREVPRAVVVDDRAGDGDRIETPAREPLPRLPFAEPARPKRGTRVLEFPLRTTAEWRADAPPGDAGEHESAR